jgi:hypothetical protein
MEPFFIFCVVLVIYCSYLTLIDLLNGEKTAMAPAPTVRKAAERFENKVPVRRRVSSDRGGVGGRVGQFATLSRGSA